MDFIKNNTSEIIIGVCVVGWVFDNILAEIPQIAANSTFQLAKNIVDKVVEKVRMK